MSKFSRLCALGALGVISLTASLAHAQAQTLDPRNVPGPRQATPLAASPAAPAAAAAPSATGDNNLGMALLGAQVSATGAVNVGVGATGASQISSAPGNYEVDFNRDVSKCLYSATPFSYGYIATTVQPRSGNANGVFLIMQTPSGTAANASFYLTVYCAK